MEAHSALDLDGDSAGPSELEAHFSAAADRVAAAAGGGGGAAAPGVALSTGDRLRLYGLYKQALEGPCSSGRPPFWDLQGRAKWCGNATPILTYLPVFA